MFALLEIACIYKALKLFADLQGPICYKDPKNKGTNLIVYQYNRVKFAYYFHTNYDLNLQTAEFLVFAGNSEHYMQPRDFHEKMPTTAEFRLRPKRGMAL